MSTSAPIRRRRGDDITVKPIAVKPISVAAYDDEPTGWSNVREVPAWAISLGVHLLILMVLGSLTQVTLLEDDSDVITSALEELDAEDYKFDATVIDQLGNNSDANQLGPSQATATQVGPKPEHEMEQQLEEEILTVDTPPTNEITQPNEAEFADAVDISGAATETPAGVEGSIDRLTYEIAGSLKERKTLVIWMFDESGSQAPRRNLIADRFENVYKQLGLLNVEAEKVLKTAIVGFSERTNFYTEEPVDDIKPLVDVIRNIKNASSPKENVFTAVEQVTKKWMSYRTKMRRNIMIVIVTDERGDDYNKLEDAIALTSRYGIRVYCVGNASPFGREKGYVTWTYEDGFQEELPVDQGPETVLPERLQLGFWGIRGFGRRQMSAGYGPYGLTRLCAESKGLYLIADQGAGPKFDPAIMRNYHPDYRPIRFYMQDLKKSLTKTKLVEAAMLTAKKSIPLPRLVFRAENDNVLRVGITEAQKPVAEFDYRLQEMHAVLAMGEKDRKKVTEPRWRAGYDLAMGRILAMRVRSFGYNVILAAMKAAPKEYTKKGSNTWRLVPARDINSGPSVRKMAKQSIAYLKSVVDDHPGTPWALLAERELSQPMGWEWQEFNVNYTASGTRGGPDNKLMVLFADDPKNPGKKKKIMKKRTRPPL